MIFLMSSLMLFFFFNDTATTEIYTLSLHDALPICVPPVGVDLGGPVVLGVRLARCAGCTGCWQAVACGVELPAGGGLGVLAVGGRSQAPGAVVAVAQQLRGLARGAGLFYGDELAQAVVVVAAAEDLAEGGVGPGGGGLQRCRARGC